MKTIRFWLTNSRPISLPQSMMPAVTACVLAAKYPDFKWYLALCCIFGVGFAHLCMNLFDDLFDYLNAEQGDRITLARGGIRAMTVKCPALQDGTANPWQWLFASCIFGMIAVAFGVPVFLMRGGRILLIVLAAGILGIFYSARPLKLSYNGFGELIIGTIFGPLITIGICLGSAGEVHNGDVLLAVCMGLLVVNILYVHSIMDYAADQKAGKRTLAWLVHGENNRYIALGAINLIPYVLILVCVCAGILPAWYLLAFCTLPWSIALVLSMLGFRKDPYGPIEKKWWYGRFSNWEQIRQAGIDWFMLRWLLAQKIDTVFCILCILATILAVVA